MELKLKNIEELKKISNEFPEYDVDKLRSETKEDPKWISFGTGNIFRGYIADLNQKLINKGLYDRGINVISSRGRSSLDAIYDPYDNLAVSVVLNNNGDFEADLIGSLAEALDLEIDKKRVKKMFLNPNLQIVSYIITEKGYNIYNTDGSFLDQVERDLEGEPKDAKHLMSQTVYLLYLRYLHGKRPVTLLSMDNLSNNGDVLKGAILEITKKWLKLGHLDQGFLDYINDENKVAFPISMIDRITPGPEEEIAAHLRKIGFSDVEIKKDSKGKEVAPFVNSEKIRYLVIEDKFTNGRPRLEEVGVYLTDRDTVIKTETMKVSTCLNPLHTSLAILGCLLGYKKISDEMEDEDLHEIVAKIGYDEGLPVVEDPGIIRPKEFIDEVINIRFPNPYIPDTPQRIATDTSQKLSQRFGSTIRKYQKTGRIKDLKFIPFVLAAWFRYLMGLDDELEEFTISPDPLARELKDLVQGLEIGKENNYDKIRDYLKNERVFGLDLVEAKLDDLIISYLDSMTRDKGAVRKKLKEIL